MSALKRLVVVAAAASVGVLTTPIAAAPPAVALRLATIVPTASPWHVALQEMGTTWDKETQGRVKVNVFPNGSLGADANVVRSMRTNSVQATLMLLSGLSQIDESFSALGMPFFFQNDAETQAVVTALTPMIEQRISAKGFHLLGWTNGGWVQVFSKTPLKSLNDVKATKLWTSDGDTKMVQWYKTNGFNPVALDVNAIAPSLKLGNINATPSSAFGALLLNLYKDAPYMLDVHVAPLLGALVITKASWDAISPADQAALTAAAKTFETKTSSSIPAFDAGAIETMKGKGLTVSGMTGAAAADLRAQADKLVASMRGEMVPADVFDAAKAARDKFRGSKAPGSK